MCKPAIGVMAEGSVRIVMRWIPDGDKCAMRGDQGGVIGDHKPESICRAEGEHSSRGTKDLRGRISRLNSGVDIFALSSAHIGRCARIAANTGWAACRAIVAKIEKPEGWTRI